MGTVVKYRLARIDFETRSKYELRLSLAKYCADPSTEALMMGWQIYDVEQIGDVIVSTSLIAKGMWIPGCAAKQIAQLLNHVRNGGLVTAYNAAFEMGIWNGPQRRNHDWPSLDLDQVEDTQLAAMVNGLPMSLAWAADASGTPVKKDKDGQRLIKTYSIPDKKTGELTDLTKHPKDYALFQSYCATDVEVENALGVKLAVPSSQQHHDWRVTFAINAAGVPIDVPFIVAAEALAQKAKAEIDRRIRAATHGAIQSASQAPAINDWLFESEGILLPDMTKATLAETVETVEMSDVAAEVIDLRRQGSLTSVAKYRKMRLMAVPSTDGWHTLKGMLNFYGAGATGRYSSRGINLQNLANPSHKHDEVVLAVDRIKKGAGLAALEALFGPIMPLLSSCIRPAICAPPGFGFVDRDYSSIENRIGPWLAGEDDYIDRVFLGGLDEYKEFAAKHLLPLIYGGEAGLVSASDRKVAKSAVLGCLFGQGAKGLIVYAAGAGVVLSEGSSQHAVDVYRKLHTGVTAAWRAHLAAAIRAVNNPGRWQQAGRGVAFAFTSRNNVLGQRLPSGRILRYWDAKVEAKKTPWGDMRDVITAMGMDSYTRKWVRVKHIGAKLFQHSTQGTAADVIAWTTRNLVRRGVDVRMLIHDEVLALAQWNDTERVAGIMDEEMSKTPPWAEGLPLECKGWTGKRFRK